MPGSNASYPKAQAAQLPTSGLPTHTYPTLHERVDRVLTETFGPDFIERKMREHREWQERLAAKGAKAIVKEVIGAYESFQEVRVGKGPGKIARLK